MAEPNDPIRVLVADDHPIVAEGLRRFFASVDEIEVLATVSSVDALVVALTHTPRVDVVVLDVDFPGMAGADTVRAIRGHGPEVVLFTHQTADDLVATMIRAGARGYVSKSVPVDALVDAIAAARAGRDHLPDDLRVLVDRASASPPHAQLTGRELSVFSLLAKGRTAKEIGFELDLAPSTVYAHVERVKAKLGVQTAVELERYAARWGIARS